MIYGNFIVLHKIQHFSLLQSLQVTFSTQTVHNLIYNNSLNNHFQIFIKEVLFKRFIHEWSKKVHQFPHNTQMWSLLYKCEIKIHKFLHKRCINFHITNMKLIIQCEIKIHKFLHILIHNFCMLNLGA